MSKITIALDEGKRKYDMEFNRKTAQLLQDRGFEADAIGSKPNIMIPLLVRTALIMHHPKLSADIADEIWASVEDKEAFIGALLTCYMEPVNALFEAPSKSKKAEWTVEE